MSLKNLSSAVGLGQSLFEHSAKYHKKCYELFANAKLDRLQRTSVDAVEELPRPTTRSAGNIFHIF